jgi:hypothetical protein
MDRYYTSRVDHLCNYNNCIKTALNYDAPYPDIHASKDTAVIARGKHFVYGLAHCVDCHNAANADSLIAAGEEVPLTGALLLTCL